jgi:hypothetical protein
MKKADYYKQSTSEVLSGDICLENPEIFKIFIQLKALCFQCEIKETPYTYKQAVKRFEVDNISYLIDEGYVYRINNNECDFLCVPEITDNVYEVVDYKKLNSIRGKLGVQKVRLKKLEEAGSDTGEVLNKILELEMLHLDEKNKTNDRLNTRLTINNKIKIKKNNINNIEELNYKKLELKNTITKEEEELIRNEYSR